MTRCYHFWLAFGYPLITYSLSINYIGVGEHFLASLLRKGGKIMLYIVILFVSISVGYYLSKVLSKKKKRDEQ